MVKNKFVIKIQKVTYSFLKVCQYCWSISNAVGARLGIINCLAIFCGLVFFSFSICFIFPHFPNNLLLLCLMSFAKVIWHFLAILSVMVIIALIYSQCFDRSNIGTFNKVLFLNSTPFVLLIIGIIIGSKDLNKQKILLQTKKPPIYEIHLRKEYSNAGTITTDDIIDILKHLKSNYHETIFYTFTSMNLANILDLAAVPYTPIHISPTKINPKHARRVKKRSSNYWFYIIKL